MKQILIYVLSFYSLTSYSQSFKNDTLISSTGYKVYEGLELSIGNGSQDDGFFTHIQRNQTGFGTAMSNTSNARYNNHQNELNKNYKGYKAKVVGFRKRGAVVVPMVTFKGQLGMKWEVDIEPAIKSGEVIVPDEYLPKKKENVVVVQNGTLSVADELTKLKKLYDDGVLTKEEYEDQKKKILNK